MKTKCFKILLLLSVHVFAQSDFEIKSGWNLSNFSEIQSNAKIGVIFGINKEWTVFRNHSISAGLLYTAKGGIIKNKTIGYYSQDVIYAYDIHSSIGYIDIPLLIHIYKQIKSNTKIHLFLGPSLSVAIHDNSFLRKKEIRYNRLEYQPEEWEALTYDYSWNTDPGPIYILGSSGYTLNIGIGLKQSNYLFELQYSLSLHKVDTIRGVFLSEEKLQSINLILGICFK